jgi:hypothetical protein
MATERPALALIEDAIQLLRAAPMSAYALYASGTVPFLLTFFSFCASMSYSRNATEQCAPAALGVALSYCWMKGLQALSCRELVRVHTGTPMPWWKPGTLLGIWSRQIALQPLGLVLNPLSWLLVFPGAYVATFFQNVTIIGGTVPRDVKKSWDLARLWPKQNFAVFGLLSLLAPILLFDLYALTISIPFALKNLLGIDTFLTRSSAWIYSSILFIALSTATYFLVDLLIKAVDVIRCCDGESLATGEDLSRRLKELRKSEGPLRAP